MSCLPSRRGGDPILNERPILKRNPDGPYYSPGDERAFYEWANRISCIDKIEGSGQELRINIRRRRISNSCLRELIALFHRYDVEMSQLAQFENASNRPWFRNQSMFWYRAVFGHPARQPQSTSARSSRRLRKKATGARV
jgi:hypothetical protein